MTPTETKSFPSQFAPPSVKRGPRHCKQYAEAFHEESAHLPTEQALTRTNKSYKRMRQYGRGEQSQLQYKELMGLKRERKDGDIPNGSFRNLNFEILKVAPKIRNVVVNKIVNQPFRMRARAIDPKSISNRRRYKAKLLEFMVNKDQIEHFELLSKLGLERPVPPGEVPPANVTEIDPYIDMNPKDITAMEVLDFLTAAFAECDWTQQGREIAGDLVDLGVAGTRQYIDVNNKIKFRRILIENSITNKCVFPDFRDLIRFGEYLSMTVGELRKATSGSLGEKAYQDIANKVAGNQKYGGSHADFYDASSYSYSYDHEKVTVLDCLWYSTDTEVNTEYRNESGNLRIKQKEFDYVPYRGDVNVNGGKGMSDDEYKKFNEGKKQIYRTEVRNVYQCSWVVDTDYVYNEGLMKNMLRPSTNWQETVMPVTLITTDFLSTMSVIEQPLDQVQLNYLQYQSHVSASKPPGIAIEKHALARLTKGKSNWDPKKALEMYAESGNFVYDGYDEHGNALQQYPFRELANGLSEGAGNHFQLMLQWIDMIRTTLGINIMTEGQTPPERMGKTVAQLSFGASDNALSHLTAAYKSIYERTGRNMFYLLQTNVQRMGPEQLSESLGSESYKYFRLNQDLGLLDMGIILEEGPDDKVKENITGLLLKMAENKEIPGEDAIMIEMIDNPYRQVLMIRKHRLEREASELNKQRQLVKDQGDQQSQLAQVQSQEKQKIEEQAFGNMMKAEEVKAQNLERLRDKEFTYEIILKKLEQAQALEEHEKEMVNDVMKTMIKSEADIKKERSKPKPVVSKTK